VTINVLFVCLGNICRSPTADAVFKQRVDAAGLAEKIQVDSAGTAAFHLGKQPDPRAIAAAEHRGYDLTPLVARQIAASDYDTCDYILAMDRMNLSNIQAMAPANGDCHIELFLKYGKQKQYAQVPDPYYEGPEGFELVLDLVEGAADGLLQHIQDTRL